MKLFSTFLLAAATAVTAQAAETVFECPLNTQEQADQWTVIDNNHDDYTWEFDDYFETMGCSTTNPDMGADDWLISPEINVEAGMYMLAFEYRGSSGDKMDVFYGNGQTIEDMDNLLLDLPYQPTAISSHTPRCLKLQKMAKYILDSTQKATLGATK